MSRTTPSSSALPPDARLYRALVERDADFEGVFVVGVRSTGIFCRPTCPARKPKAENCLFFPGAREAISAGFRACRRCRPLERAAAMPAIVEQLVARVHERPDRRWRDRELRAEGLDPVQVRRRFKETIGMTFHAFQRAHRLGLAMGELTRTGSVTAGARRAGYDSASGFAEAFAALFGTTPGRADAHAVLRADWIDTPLGPMVCVVHADGLCLLEFSDRRALETELAFLRTHFDSAIVPECTAISKRVRTSLGSYFVGDDATFDVPLLLPGSEFDRLTWNALRAIPRGETRTYAEQATAIGRPNAVRAVARANGRNRVAIIVPCHRVLGSDGDLRGYAGGIWRKRRLLELEGALAGSST